MEFHSSKLSDSKLWVNYTSRGISSRNLDIKYNNLSFDDPNWVIPIGEETLES